MFVINRFHEQFWTASVEEIKQGYLYHEHTEEFICLVCGQRFEKGIIYSEDHVFYEAEKFAQQHIMHKHSSMFESLMSLDKKWTGLSEIQNKLMHLFYRGLSDKEIVQETGGGSASTIRNHRFTLREKIKQAKIFLAIMELAEEKAASHKLMQPHSTPAVADRRFAITEEETDKVLRFYFNQGLDGPLLEFPKKQKRKMIILQHILKKFDASRAYTEKEVNAILKSLYPDYVTLRRYLIDYGYMERNPDGSSYWVKQS